MKGFLVSFHLDDAKAEKMFVLRTVERSFVGVKLRNSVISFEQAQLIDIQWGNCYIKRTVLFSTAERNLTGIRSNVTKIIN